MLAKLGGESDTVTVVRERHWAAVEWLAIHQDDETALNRTRSRASSGLPDR